MSVRWQNNMLQVVEPVLPGKIITRITAECVAPTDKELEPCFLQSKIIQSLRSQPAQEKNSEETNRLVKFIRLTWFRDPLSTAAKCVVIDEKTNVGNEQKSHQSLSFTECEQKARQSVQGSESGVRTRQAVLLSDKEWEIKENEWLQTIMKAYRRPIRKQSTTTTGAAIVSGVGSLAKIVSATSPKANCASFWIEKNKLFSVVALRRILPGEELGMIWCPIPGEHAYLDKVREIFLQSSLQTTGSKPKPWSFLQTSLQTLQEHQPYGHVWTEYIPTTVWKLQFPELQQFQNKKPTLSATLRTIDEKEQRSKLQDGDDKEHQRPSFEPENMWLAEIEDKSPEAIQLAKMAMYAARCHSPVIRIPFAWLEKLKIGPCWIHEMIDSGCVYGRYTITQSKDEWVYTWQVKE